MADREKKDYTPPPLLLMPAGGGLTLNPPDQPSLLVPVVQSEPSLIGSDEEGEADSFIGQSPTLSQSQPTAFHHFQQTSGSDPFSDVGHNPVPPKTMGHPGMMPAVSQHTTMGHPGMMPGAPQPTTMAHPGMMPPSHASPFSSPASAPPPAAPGSTGNVFRKTESLRKVQYAQMPAGTYAPNAGQMMSPGPPNQHEGPPVAQVLPTVSQSLYQPTMMSSPMPPKPDFTSSPGPQFSPHSTGVPIPPVPQFQSPSAGPPRQQFVGVPQSSAPGEGGVYTPVQPHWCYCKTVEGKQIWHTFSLLDSMRLEEAMRSGNHGAVIATDGGRYDVALKERLRKSVYWEEADSPVRRCTWFYKREGDNRYVPYEETFANQLETEYRNAVQYNVWHKRLEFPGGETIVMHNANVIVHFQASSQPDEWGTSQNKSGAGSMTFDASEGMRPRVVKRGVEDFDTISDGEPTQIDHLVFVVHGIGDFCDVKFRNIIECVDDFRAISLNLLQSHFKQYVDRQQIGRVEFIPVEWHDALHGDTTGLDKRLKTITLPSTSKLRHFVNNTLMDVLFYTSPTYCQTIADQVGNEMNRLYELFMERNPNFQGGISVAGHSLGSSVLFDLLMHQRDKLNASQDSLSADNIGIPTPSETELSSVQESLPSEAEETTLEELLKRAGLEDKVSVFHQEQIDLEALKMCSESDLKDLGLAMGPRKKLQGVLKEEEKKEKERAENKLKIQQKQETQKTENTSSSTEKSNEQRKYKKYGSISVEFLLGPAGTGQPFVQYPQINFELSSFFALGSPIGIFLSARGVNTIGEEFALPTCSKVFNIFHPFDPVAYRLEPLVNPAATNVKPVLIPHHKGRKRLHLELKESLTRVGADIKQKIMESLKSTWNSINEFAKAHRTQTESLEAQVDNQMSSVMHELDDDVSSTTSSCHEDIYMGQLNEGHRIDYVLQERPIESFNDYLFALSSHGCYWESEDTVLLVLKELYLSKGFYPQMPGPDGSVKLYNTSPPEVQKPKAMPAPSMNFSQDSAMGYNVRPPMTMGPRPSSEDTRPPMTTMTGTRPSGLNNAPPTANVGPPPLAGFVKNVPK